MSHRPSRLWTTIDFEKDGKQCDFLRLPHSVHRSAYGWLPIPLACIKNGEGPTVLLMSGTHGDEYEGQVTVTNLLRELEPSDVGGRLIFLPMANYPAAKAGLRTSPVDEGNLNRVFPGDPAGRPTHQIAYYVETVLMPLADYSLDLHSGGSSLMYEPTVMLGGAEDPDERFAERLELAAVFGAPYVFRFRGPGDHTSGGAAARNGVAQITTEMGGSGTVTPRCLAICERGVRNVLAHLGVLRHVAVEAPARPTRMLRALGHGFFIHAMEDGLFEPTVELGAEVTAGQRCGRIHTPETPWRAPSEVRFDRDGVLVCKRIPGRVERGDCLGHIGEDVPEV